MLQVLFSSAGRRIITCAEDRIRSTQWTSLDTTHGHTYWGTYKCVGNISVVQNSLKSESILSLNPDYSCTKGDAGRYGK